VETVPTPSLDRNVPRLRALGFLLLAVLLPGGLPLALVAWLYQHRRKGDPE
jgi:hypothetical protein